MRHALRSIDHAIWKAEGRARSPYAGQPCQVLVEGRGPGPRNVLVQLESQVEGQQLVVTIRREKSLRPLRRGERQVELF